MADAIKDITVSRVNPLIRIPARLFKNIDKRKKRIPLKVYYNDYQCTIEVDLEQSTNLTTKTPPAQSMGAQRQVRGQKGY